MQQVVGRLFAAKYFTKEAKEDVSVFSFTVYSFSLFLISFKILVFNPWV